jgi:RNA polymerase sigma-70 factor (ECF subfamily)
MEQVNIAEDIAGETFLAALETWPYKGIPQNPSAWLYTVAKNKCRNYLKRYRHSNQLIANQQGDKQEEFEMDFSESFSSDSMLQMLFAISHPSIPITSQTALALRILCGFGIDEIASAFLTNKEAINKRLLRAKEKFRNENIRLEMPAGEEIIARIPGVLTTIYLLFNEGYYSETNEQLIRKDLCFEAMQLAMLLLQKKETNLPVVNALMALMCFHTSRLDARLDKQGEIILYEDQNRSLWNRDLIARGAEYFKNASVGNTLSQYHIEAGIAYWYTVEDNGAQKWEQILFLYNCLLQLQYSPVAALNRAYAISKTKGIKEAIRETEKLNLENNRFYHVLLGKLYRHENPKKSLVHYLKAISLAPSAAEKQLLQSQVNSIHG